MLLQDMLKNNLQLPLLQCWRWVLKWNWETTPNMLGC